MIDKQQIVVDLLNERLPQTKVGIIVKGVDSIDADKITASVAESTGQYIYAAAIPVRGTTIFSLTPLKKQCFGVACRSVQGIL